MEKGPGGLKKLTGTMGDVTTCVAWKTNKHTAFFWDTGHRIQNTHLLLRPTSYTGLA